MPPDEEKAHLKECPDKKIAEVQKYNVPLPGKFFPCFVYRYKNKTGLKDFIALRRPFGVRGGKGLFK